MNNLNEPEKLSNSEVEPRSKTKGGRIDSKCPTREISEWNPSIDELPLDYYDYERVPLVGTGRSWEASFTSRIASVQIAPPIYEKIPYVYGEGSDYWGEYGSGELPCPQWVEVSINRSGVYVLKITFVDASTYIRFLVADAVSKDGDQSASGRKKMSRIRVFVPRWSDCVIIHPELVDQEGRAFRALGVPFGVSHTLGSIIGYTRIFHSERVTERKVLLCGHGEEGLYVYGNRAGDILAGRGQTVLDFTEPVRGVHDVVAGVYFLSCNTAIGLDRPASPVTLHVMEEVAKLLRTRSRFKETFTVGFDGLVWIVGLRGINEYVHMVGAGVRLRAYRWDGTLGVVTDEPIATP